MNRPHTLFLAVANLAVAATVSPAIARDIPEKLAPPMNEEGLFDVVARGFQVYECAEGKSGAPEWVFRGPEATLSDNAGAQVGKHYGGPTWESTDGSLVVGEMVASAPADDSHSIPQLLLRAKSHSGTGRFASVSSIQRLQTHGGVAPSSGCTVEQFGTVLKSPYVARYFFYGRKRD